MKFDIVPSVHTDDLLALAGRLLLAAIFLASAFGKITNFDGTTKFMELHGMFWTPMFCAAAIVVESLGGMSLMLGFHARLSSVALAGFVVAVTWIFHGTPDQRVQLLKNLAIIGGLLTVAAHGPGPLSLEGKRP